MINMHGHTYKSTGDSFVNSQHKWSEMNIAEWTGRRMYNDATNII